MGRYSPWRHLRSLPELDLTWTVDEALLDGAEARYFATVQHIVMDARLSQAERRSVLAHEVAHHLRGDLPTGDAVLDARQEGIVDQWAARMLIDLPALIDALRWSDDRAEVADLLWVTPEVLDVRLRHLHPTERGSIVASLGRPFADC